MSEAATQPTNADFELFDIFAEEDEAYQAKLQELDEKLKRLEKSLSNLGHLVNSHVYTGR